MSPFVDRSPLRRGERWTWVVGDVQGCADPLGRLMREIDFDPSCDVVWFAGDLVNRGPASLDVLRWLVEQDTAVDAVLGNHDFHLLALVAGVDRKPGTLAQVLDAPDRERLIEWLRHRPLMVDDVDAVIVHAGLSPAWTFADAVHWEQTLRGRLQGPQWRDWLLQIYSDHGDSEQIRAEREALSYFTRIRGCDADANLSSYSGPPGGCPPGVQPWYRWVDWSQRVYFGHWAAHGVEVRERWVSLDSGAVWGGELSAIRMVDDRVARVAATQSGPGD